MNYYKKIAEMLGVELDEEFSLKNNDDEILSSKYKVTASDGLLFKWNNNWGRSNRIIEIINGKLTIVKLPWKPKKGEPYWYYSAGWKEATLMQCEDNLCDMLYWKIGNCFRTEEEAKAKGKEIMEQIQKEYEEA